MCIAILNKSQKLSKTTLKTCWDNNPDGAGLLYSDGSNLQFHKELIDFDEFYKNYSLIRGYYKTPIVVHFRIATSGKINETNCHPFIINDHIGFVHNGICSLTKGTKLHSDTYQLNDIFKELPKNFIYNPSIVKLIEHAIGYSKLVFLDNKGKYSFVNEDLGHWDKKGNWYSNTNYKQHVYTWVRPYQNKYYENHLESTNLQKCDFCNVKSELQFDIDTHCYLCAECLSFQNH